MDSLKHLKDIADQEMKKIEVTPALREKTMRRIRQSSGTRSARGRKIRVAAAAASFLVILLASFPMIFGGPSKTEWVLDSGTATPENPTNGSSGSSDPVPFSLPGDPSESDNGHAQSPVTPFSDTTTGPETCADCPGIMVAPDTGLTEVTDIPDAIRAELPDYIPEGYQLVEITVPNEPMDISSFHEPTSDSSVPDEHHPAERWRAVYVSDAGKQYVIECRAVSPTRVMHSSPDGRATDSLTLEEGPPLIAKWSAAERHYQLEGSLPADEAQKVAASIPSINNNME